MKKTFLFLATSVVFYTTTQAQSDKYTSAMKNFIATADSAKSGEDFQNASNNFERIAQAEKSQWLPYYYAAYSLVMKCYASQEKSNIDEMMDKADGLLDQAEALSKDNSEITTLRAMTTQCRMMVDWSRGRTLGPKCAQLIAQAQMQAPKDNPRAYMFQAQSAYYTPEAFGGSRSKGKELMKKSIELFKAFKPESELHPHWGQQHAEKTLEEWAKQ